MNKEKLLAFSTAWKNGNVEEIMSFFSEDCIYKASVGSEPRTTFIGVKEVAIGIEKMIAFDNAVSSEVSNIKIDGDFGFWEWTYTYSNGDIVKGCDVFEFGEDLIKTKNAFRKVTN